MEEIGISELGTEELEKLCEVAEKAARECILSKVSSRRVSTLDVAVDTEGTKPVTVNVEVEVALSPLTRNLDAEKLAKEATEKAFAAVRNYLSGLSCKSTR